MKIDFRHLPAIPEFFKRQNRISATGSGKTQTICEETVCETENKSQDIVDSFFKRNISNGKSIIQYSQRCLSLLAKFKEISQGAFFVTDNVDGKPVLRFISGFAMPDTAEIHDILEMGEGLPGEVAKTGRIMNISDIPEGYLNIESGLGKSSPVSLLLFPVKNADKVLAVIEISSFHKFTEEDEYFFSSVSPSIAEQILKCKIRI